MRRFKKRLQSDNRDCLESLKDAGKICKVYAVEEDSVRKVCDKITIFGGQR